MSGLLGEPTLGFAVISAKSFDLQSAPSTREPGRAPGALVGFRSPCCKSASLLLISLNSVREMLVMTQRVLGHVSCSGFASAFWSIPGFANLNSKL